MRVLLGVGAAPAWHRVVEHSSPTVTEEVIQKEPRAISIVDTLRRQHIDYRDGADRWPEP
jgi:hypothetical protein